jgi:hypothetical protein
MDVPPFERSFFDPSRRLSRIGGGSLGGKAQGLILAARVLEAHRDELAALGFEVDVPALVILGTDLFDAFLDRNALRSLAVEDLTDDRVAHAFQRAELPAEWVGDLRALIQEVRVPLAVRSSSGLEDAVGQPFAGVYGTKMIPANQPSADARFKSLVEAVKFVLASTYFHEARAYMRATRQRPEDEKMAVIVQQVVGRAHGPRFYPDISGVARSWSFYPGAGARPEEGVVHLALGLGKTIVDGGLCWWFSPAQPRAMPPFNSVGDLMKLTQTEFWAVNIGPPPPWDPMTETEYLVRAGLTEAEADGTLRFSASTYDPRSERLTPGTGRSGPRVLDFAPLLQSEEVPLARLLERLLALCHEKLATPVEVEFALTLAPGSRPRLGFLQVRPLLRPGAAVEVTTDELRGEAVLLASEAALGNGERALADVVYVDPEAFEARLTPGIAEEIEQLNRPLLEAGRPYLLIGFGRWGSSDPWLGIPVRWDQISGARAVVEAARPGMSPEPSQGSHFFHNLSSFEVAYLSLPCGAEIDWPWLGAQPTVARTAHVRHVRCPRPLRLRVDGRSRRGVVLKPETT